MIALFEIIQRGHEDTNGLIGYSKLLSGLYAFIFWFIVFYVYGSVLLYADKVAKSRRIGRKMNA